MSCEFVTKIENGKKQLCCVIVPPRVGSKEWHQLYTYLKGKEAEEAKKLNYTKRAITKIHYCWACGRKKKRGDKMAHLVRTKDQKAIINYFCEACFDILTYWQIKLENCTYMFCRNDREWEEVSIVTGKQIGRAHV